MKKRTRLSRERLLELIARHNGNVLRMADEAGCPRKSIYRRIEAEQLHTAVDAARRAGELREMRDRVAAAIEAGDRRAMWHALIDLHQELGDEITSENLVVWLRELIDFPTLQHQIHWQLQLLDDLMSSGPSTPENRKRRRA